MKASEVLDQYAKGKRDFQGVDLKGQSFKGQDLSGADFSGAKIQGANFTNAILRESNFCSAKAGLKQGWKAILVVVSLLLTTLSGVVAGYAGWFIMIPIFKPDIIVQDTRVPGLLVLAALVVFIVILIFRGLAQALTAFALALIAALAMGLVMFQVGTMMLPLIASLVSIVAGSVAIAMAFAVAGYGTLIAALIVALVVAPFAAGMQSGAGICAILFMLLNGYIAWKCLTGKQQYSLIRKMAIAFAAIGGTSFRNGDLTDADFHQASLKSTDFRGATLTRTNFNQSEKLNLVRPGKTYLSNPEIRQLVTTGEGKNKYFDRLDLRGVNLEKAHLENTSFIDADFYQANLQGANLSRARLVRTNLERADLRDANLTGSCIQDWIISESTKLDGINCEYVFLKWVSKIENGLDKGDKRDQMPPRGKFKGGGFVTFVSYILETVELYHEKDINPRLALNVLKKMSKDYDEPLDIVAVGKRGGRVFVKVKLSESVEQERFKQDYYSRYDKGLKLVSSNPKQLPSVDELVENKIIEIASEKILDDNQSIQVTHVEYIMSGNFGVGVNQGQIIADTIAGTINDE